MVGVNATVGKKFLDCDANGHSATPYSDDNGGLKPSENTRSASRKESTNNWLAERYCLSLMASRASLLRLELKGPPQTSRGGYYLVKAIY